MIASALFMAATGVAATFAPHELLRAAGASGPVLLPLAIQLLGALYLGFAILNWTARESLLGGIYQRPVVLGNFLHFLAGALALIKGSPATAPLIAFAAVYALLAIGFAFVLFTSPVAPK